jgi:hypothetical protein
MRGVGFSDYSKSDLLLFFDSGSTMDQFENICEVVQPTNETRFTFANKDVFQKISMSSAFEKYITKENHEVIDSLDEDIDSFSFSQAGTISDALCSILKKSNSIGDVDWQTFLKSLKYGFSDKLAAKIRKYHDLNRLKSHEKKVLLFCSNTPLHHYPIKNLILRKSFTRCVLPTCFYQRPLDIDAILYGDNNSKHISIINSYKKFDNDIYADAAEVLRPGIPLFFSNLADQQYAETLIGLTESGRYRRLINIVSPSNIHYKLTKDYSHYSDDVRTLIVHKYLKANTVEKEELEKSELTLDQFWSWIAGEGKNICSSDNTFSIYIYHLLNQIYIPTIYTAISYDILFRNLINMLNQNSLIVCSGRSMESRLGVEVFRSKNLPTFDLQAGTISSSNRFRAPSADFVMCMDKTHENIYRDGFGVSEDKLLLVGSPRIDRKLEPVRALKRDRCRKDLFPEFNEKNVTVLASQPIEWEKKLEIASLCIRASSNNNILIIKLHPAEGLRDISIYKNLVENLNKSKYVIVSSEMDTYKLIVAADFVATYFSTIAIEAFSLGRKVIIIDPFEVEPKLNFYKSGIGRRVKTSNDLIEIWNEIDAHEYISENHTEVTDGQSSRRIWAQIDNASGASSRKRNRLFLIRKFSSLAFSIFRNRTINIY